MSSQAKVLIAGSWQKSAATEFFRAVDPQTGQAWGDEFPVSPLAETERMLQAAAEADEIVRDWPGQRFAEFLEAYAEEMAANIETLAQLAHTETGLPLTPRLLGAELPRTINQLKTAATCARSAEWATPLIDRELNIRSCYRSLGPVLIFGPNNFPLAFNSVSGGDFAAAVAAGNPVIAKGHPNHPGTTRLLAELAQQAAERCDFPPGFFQLIYHMEPDTGLRMIQDSRIAAVGFTGSRGAGEKIKAAADQQGKPVYVEMSSINPVFIFPGLLAEKGASLAEEFTGSCLMGSGQFCTNPGLVILPPGNAADQWIADVKARFEASSCGPLFSAGVRDSFLQSIQQLQAAGAELLTGGEPAGEQGFAVKSTLLRVSAEQFLQAPDEFQREAFGNSSLLVTTRLTEDFLAVARCLEGQLTATVYLSEQAADEALYARLEPILRRKAGRLLNNKMPTGVAVSPAMNHGGPYPATGHPGFTAVGLPAAIRRFAMLQCYDQVPQQRLPPLLQD